MPFIKNLVSQGIIVAIGHTKAGSEKIREAVEAGAMLSTHLGNGTSTELPKNNNPIISQLSEDKLSASFIADGYHISQETLKVYLKSQGIQKDPFDNGRYAEQQLNQVYINLEK